MFYYSKISNHICNKRSRYSAQAKIKVILLLCYCYTHSGPAVNLQDWRITSFTSSSSMFHSLTLFLVSLYLVVCSTL